MKRCVLGLVCLLFSCAMFAGEGETRISLDGWWNFKIDPYYQGEKEQWFSSSFKTTDWDKMPVPGNWELRNEYASYVGLGWYRTTFATPKDIKDKVLSLFLEAVNVNYTFWVNGIFFGKVIGGYFPHYFDVTKILLPQGKNTVTVCADNNFRTGAYWSWGGIRRSVQLLMNNKAHINRVQILAEPDLKKGTAEIAIKTILDTPQKAEEYTLYYEILKNGKSLGMKVSNFVSANNSNVDSIQIKLPAKDVKLWRFDSPELYTVHLYLKRGKEILHEITERFGIRKVEIKNNVFLLNGEPVRLLGYNWVADDRFTGNTLPTEVYKTQIDDMKRAGGNMARLSHVPLPKEVLEYLDEVGMLVIDEVPVWGSGTPYATHRSPVPFSWIKQMVEDHYNHPCVIGWSVGNEIGNQLDNPDVVQYVDSAIKYVKTMDLSRPVMDVSFTAHLRKDDPSQFSDMIALNKYVSNFAADAKKAHINHNLKPVFISEFGCQLITENLKSDFSKETKALNDMRGIDFLFGASLWTYNDYRSGHRSPNSTWDNPVSENRSWGIVDAYGNHKLAYSQARKEYAPLKNMGVTEVASGEYSVKLTPRSKLDLPAYIMRGYFLSVTALDDKGKEIKRNSIRLPVITPGDATFEKKIKLNVGLKASMNHIVLTNPQGIELMDTMLYAAKPDKPIINYIKTGGHKVRIYFDLIPNASHYAAYCQAKDGKILCSDTVFTPYVEIDRLEHKKEYTVTLVAINSQGETISDSKTVIAKGIGNLPPVIRCIKGLKGMNSIALGYTCEKPEYLFEIEYATSPDFLENFGKTQTPIKGACFIPYLIPGETYYVRMRSIYQYQQPTDWTPVYKVLVPKL